MANIFHIVSSSEWSSAKANGSYTPESLSNEGFIHCSQTDQLLKVANSFYSGQKGLIIVRITEEKITAQVKHEPPLEAPLSEVMFPHIYGPLNLDAVDKEIDFPVGDDGKFTLPGNLLG